MYVPVCPWRSVMTHIGSPMLMFAVVGLASGTALAQPAPDYDFQWATVGAPGNRPTNANETFDGPFGSVGHSYRMAKTEVTVEQWADFLRAYEPFNTTGNLGGSDLTSIYIRRNQGGGYSYDPAVARFPVSVTWDPAARYCNWLHNGKASGSSSVESGVYDTSTFKYDSNGFPLHNYAAAPGSKFWIPTFDELIKAMYYDPNRHGAGQDGYWKYPNSSDSLPIPGLPGTGGTTNAGLPASVAFMPVGQYPHAVSPWGLLDTSGGVSERSSSSGGAPLRFLFKHGSLASSEFIDFSDALANAGFGTASPRSSEGIRIASIVPGVPSCAPVLMYFMFQRRRHRCSS